MELGPFYISVNSDANFDVVWHSWWNRSTYYFDMYFDYATLLHTCTRMHPISLLIISIQAGEDQHGRVHQPPAL